MNVEIPDKHLPLSIVTTVMVAAFGGVSWSQAGDINTLQEVVTEQAVIQQKIKTITSDQAETKTTLKEILHELRNQPVQVHRSAPTPSFSAPGPGHYRYSEPQYRSYGYAPAY